MGTKIGTSSFLLVILSSLARADPCDILTLRAGDCVGQQLDRDFRDIDQRRRLQDQREIDAVDRMNRDFYLQRQIDEQREQTNRLRDDMERDRWMREMNHDD
jgi:hypothetical protein